VVGQAELLVALPVVIGVGYYLRRRKVGALSWRDVIVIALCNAFAVFSKENGIVFPALLLVAEWTVVADDRPWRARVATIRPLMLALVAVSLGFLLARSKVQADFAGFAPYAAFRFLNMGNAARIGTMSHEFPRIGRLMLFPSHLSADYSPNDVIIADGIGPAELPGLLMAFGVVLLAFALRRRSAVASLGLFWFVISYFPVSNILLPTGIVTAERTLFLPSVGVVLVMAATIVWMAAELRPRGRIAVLAATGVLISLGVWKSVDRQKVWANNDVLFDETVKDSPENYRAHVMRGRALGEKHRLREMEKEFRHAIKLFPYDAGVTVDVAEGYRRAGYCEPAVPLYEWSYAIEASYPDGRLGYVYCLSTMARWKDTREQALLGIQYGHPWEGKWLRNAVYVADSALGRPLRKRPPL